VTVRVVEIRRPSAGTGASPSASASAALGARVSASSGTRAGPYTSNSTSNFATCELTYNSTAHRVTNAHTQSQQTSCRSTACAGSGPSTGASASRGAAP
jgi:hypothetical protein